MKDATACTNCSKALKDTSKHMGLIQGICDDCAATTINHNLIPFQDFLDKLMVPILAVDSQGVVVTANKTAQTALKKDLLKIRGLPCGNVMECAYASLPEGCGKTDHCSGCTIRNTILTTYEDGISQNRVKALQNFNSEDGPYTMQMIVSTEKVGDVVLLRIDGKNPTELLY